MCLLAIYISLTSSTMSSQGYSNSLFSGLPGSAHIPMSILLHPLLHPAVIVRPQQSSAQNLTVAPYSLRDKTTVLITAFKVLHDIPLPNSIHLQVPLPGGRDTNLHSLPQDTKRYLFFLFSVWQHCLFPSVMTNSKKQPEHMQQNLGAILPRGGPGTLRYGQGACVGSKFRG